MGWPNPYPTSASWQNVSKLTSRSYVCGHCGSQIASQDGYLAKTDSSASVRLYICHFCDKPTLFWGPTQTPGPLFGEWIQELPRDIEELYQEARRSLQADAFTASVMCSRKLLMNIAVSKGAKLDESFAKYVDFLESNGYLTRDAKEWIDLIRSKGNEANHEIALMGQADAEQLIIFVGLLLKVIFEFPTKAKRMRGETP